MNFLQLSCVSSSTELADRHRFRSYFQMLATDENLALGFYAVIRQFNWGYVSIIQQNENLFTRVSELNTLVFLWFVC